MNDLPSVETTASGPCLVAKVRGVMDYVSRSHLREQLQHVIAPAQRPVVLDLEEVSFCDSAGLNVLLEARRDAERAAVALVLACVPVTLQRVLHMTGADQILKVFATVTDAEAALTG
ncbi:STAS domain-containing protein [Streptomyces sp. NBC_00557]|nr:STAS domain-containing protein [Streptomyces sp. NBC_00557]